jgi:septal ring factor EnvC (AmiA/AmiB activator)
LISGLTCLPTLAGAQDREEELDALRERIRDSRERVTEHEADERALLEQLEEVDRRLMQAVRDQRDGQREVARARRRVDELAPRLEKAERALGRTQHALAVRAVALYKGGEVGPVRVLFSSTSLPEMLSRASALRVLVRHDAELVARFEEERDRLAQLRADAQRALATREAADRKLASLTRGLKEERASKGVILARTRADRTTERRLLLELEQAAQALEETIRAIGARAESGSVASGFGGRRGRLAAPVSADVIQPFGQVVDPEFGTRTFRSGVDFGAEAGARVRAVASGIVRFAGWFRGYGRIVIVDHGDGYHSICGHLDEILVEVGHPLEEGEVLGTVGETGSLGGPRLYFELREKGDPIDPEIWLMDPRA